MSAGAKIVKTVSHQETYDEAVTSVRACVVYHMWRWRNSWRGSESLNYRGSDHHAPSADEQAMATTLVSAKTQAERWRAPGSVFHVREIPSLLVEAGSTRMVFAEVNSNDPFSHWEPNLAIIGQPLRRMGQKLWGLRSDHWDMNGRLRAMLREDETAEDLAEVRIFRDWTSSPGGAKGNKLRWSGQVARTSADAVRSIVDAFSRNRLG